MRQDFRTSVQAFVRARLRGEHVVMSFSMPDEVHFLRAFGQEKREAAVGWPERKLKEAGRLNETGYATSWFSTLDQEAHTHSE